MAKQQEFIKDNDKGNLKGNWVSPFPLFLSHRIIYFFIVRIICTYSFPILIHERVSKVKVNLSSKMYSPRLFLRTQVFRTEQKSTKVHLKTINQCYLFCTNTVR